MEIILLATSLVASVIFLTIFITLIRDIKSSSFKSKETPLVVLGLTYLIFTISLFLWAINFFTFNSADFLVVFSIIIIIQTVCLLTILYKIKKNKKIFYALIPFLFLIPLIILSPHLTHLIIPTSLLITLLIFLVTTSIHKKITKYLILYTSLSLFFYLFSILWQNLIPALSLSSSILFLIFIIPFLKFLKLHVPSHLYYLQEPESPLVHFLKYFIFIIIITNFIFIGTVSVHEFGHLASSAQSNCEETKIVYELKGLPHTEIKCSDTSMKNRWILGGLALPFIVAIFLFFCGGKFIRELALQIVGFNLIISYLDLTSLNISDAIATFALILGIALSVFSLALLAKSRLE